MHPKCLHVDTTTVILRGIYDVLEVLPSLREAPPQPAHFMAWEGTIHIEETPREEIPFDPDGILCLFEGIRLTTVTNGRKIHRAFHLLDADQMELLSLL